MITADRWEWCGKTYTAGQVLPGGTIIGSNQGQFVRYGYIWIDARSLKVAMQEGWRDAGEAALDGTLVLVTRPSSYPASPLNL